MLLTALHYQSLHILALVPSLPAQTTHSETTEIMPEFEGQILSEPLKPGVGSDVILSCPVKNLGKSKV
ncbi:unnamed protein product, partial [Medioppia subpectinata]